MATINPLVVDLSHHDPADDYGRVKVAGIVGVIYKATEGTTYTDDTYVEQQKAAKAAGLKWGSYHFAHPGNIQGQIDNYMRFACPDPDEIFCLDWEEVSTGTMSAAEARQWIEGVEKALKRPGQCVIYSGNVAKEKISGVDPFFGARRLWLAQYSSNPTCQSSWSKFWLHQFTDGQVGPQPHTIPGIGPCDINSYAGAPDQLIVEWATGGVAPVPPTPEPAPEVATVAITITGDVKVTINGKPVT
jgi:lysozyme